MRILKALFIVTAAVTFSGCSKNGDGCDCFKSTGKIISEERSVSGFNYLIIEDKVNVYITQDSVFSVKVEAGENLIAKVKTELNGKELKIWNSNNCNFMRSYKPRINVYISMPEINTIVHNGTAEVKGMNTFTTDTIDAYANNSGDLIISVNNNKLLSHLHGTADFTVSGTTSEHASFATGHGFVRAENLQTSYSWIFSKSTGDARIRVSNLLVAFIRESGNIYYTGNPSSVQQEITGQGKLIGY